MKQLRECERVIPLFLAAAGDAATSLGLGAAAW